jgi:hypothetical protein
VHEGPDQKGDDQDSQDQEYFYDESSQPLRTLLGSGMRRQIHRQAQEVRDASSP